MTAYEQAMRDFEDRLEALGAKLVARDRVDEIHADSLKHVIDKFDARIETLESRAHGVMDRLREFDGYVERLEALETEQSKAISSAAMLCAQHYHERQQAAELKRQDRWHATRDAVIVAITNGQWRPYENYKPMGLDVDAIVAHASALADRAHGPLTP